MKATFFLLTSFLLFGSICFQLRAQTSYDVNRHKYYFKIRVADGSSKVFDQKSSNDVWCNTAHTGINQQWLLMPLYVRSSDGVLEASNEYIIASKSDGDVLDIRSDNTTWCNSNFHAESNQIFTLNSVPNTSRYRISSPKNVNYVLDKSNNNNGYIYFRGQHTGLNQQFTLEANGAFQYPLPTLRNIVRSTIAPPPNPTSLTATIPTETAKVFISESLIPFPMVNNDVARSSQAQYYPYYRIVKSQYWRLPDDVDADEVYPTNYSVSAKITTKYGMTSSSVTEVSTKLNVSFTASGEVAGQFFKVISAKIAGSISKAMETQTKNVSSFSETNETTTEVTSSWTTSDITRITTYQLVDHYQLFRPDGSLVTAWDVRRTSAYRIIYTTAGGGTGGRIGPNVTGTYFDILDRSAVTEPRAELKIDISPNPTNGVFKLHYEGPNDKRDVVIYIYSNAGILRRTLKIKSLTGDNTIDISDLPSGLYLLKIADGYRNNTIPLIKD